MKKPGFWFFSEKKNEKTTNPEVNSNGIYMDVIDAYLSMVEKKQKLNLFNGFLSKKNAIFFLFHYTNY